MIEKRVAYEQETTVGKAAREQRDFLFVIETFRWEILLVMFHGEAEGDIHKKKRWRQG